MERNSPSPMPHDCLSLLRSVESAPAGDLEWAEHCTRQQAMILSLQSAGGRVTSLEGLAAAIGIPIQPSQTIPVNATAFPTKDGWHIHVAASLDPAAQLHSALHELKHVIDHPVRLGTTARFSDADYEHLADYFADLVLAGPNHQPADTRTATKTDRRNP